MKMMSNIKKIHELSSQIIEDNKKLLYIKLNNVTLECNPT